MDLSHYTRKVPGPDGGSQRVATVSRVTDATNGLLQWRRIFPGGEGISSTGDRRVFTDAIRAKLLGEKATFGRAEDQIALQRRDEEAQRWQNSCRSTEDLPPPPQAKPFPAASPQAAWGKSRCTGNSVFGVVNGNSAEGRTLRAGTGIATAGGAIGRC